MKEKVCLDRSNWVIGDKIQRRAVYAQGSLTQIASLRKKPRKVERSRPTEKMAENFRIGIFFFLFSFYRAAGRRLSPAGSRAVTPLYRTVRAYRNTSLYYD
jgi:hypothetical protein